MAARRCSGRRRLRGARCWRLWCCSRWASCVLRSADLDQRAGEARNIETPLKFALGVMVPFYWGKPTQTPIDFFLLARAFYGGALPLLLAVVALRAPTRERVATAVCGAVCMCVVLGIPPVFWVVSRLPVFSSGHNTRLAVLYLLCLALLAGWGLDDLVRRGVEPARAGGRAARLLAFPVLYTVLRSRSSWDLAGGCARGRVRVRPRAALCRSGPSAGSCAARRRCSGWRSRAGVLLLAFFAAPLARGRGAGAGRGRPGLGGHRLQPGDRPRRRRAAGDAARSASCSARPRQRFVSIGDITAERDPDGLRDPRGARLRPAGREALRPALALEALARVPLAGRPAAGLHPARAAEGRRGPPALPVVPRRAAASCSRATDPPLRTAGLRVVYDRPDARIYANDAALPRAFVVGAQRRVDDAYAEITSAAFDRARGRDRRVGLSEGEPRARRARPDPPHRERPPGRRDRARAARACSCSASRGRRAGTRVMGGEELKVERVDYLFRGVRVPAGTHIVEFTYRPLSWRIGWIVVARRAARRCVGGGRWWRRRARAVSAARAARARRRARGRRAVVLAVPRRRLLRARGRARTRGSRPWVGRLDVGVPSSSCCRASCSTGRSCAGGCGVGRVRVAAGAADRPRVLGRADRRRARARLREVWANVPLFFGFRRSTATDTAGQGLGQAWTLCVEVAVLRVPAAVGARARPSRSLWPLVALFVASFAYKVLMLAHVRREGRAAGARADRAARVPRLVRAGHGRGAAGGARRALRAAVGVGGRRGGRSTWRRCCCCGTRGWTPTRTREWLVRHCLLRGDRALRARRRRWPGARALRWTPLVRARRDLLRHLPLPPARARAARRAGASARGSDTCTRTCSGPCSRSPARCCSRRSAGAWSSVRCGEPRGERPARRA